jgi:hypothetical protein
MNANIKNRIIVTLASNIVSDILFTVRGFKLSPIS